MGRYSWGWTHLPIADGAQAQLVVDYNGGSGWETIFTALAGHRWEGGAEALADDPDGFRVHERAIRRVQTADRYGSIPWAIACHHLGRVPDVAEVAAVAPLTRRRDVLGVDADAVVEALGTKAGVA